MANRGLQVPPIYPFRQLPQRLVPIYVPINLLLSLLTKKNPLARLITGWALFPPPTTNKDGTFVVCVIKVLLVLKAGVTRMTFALLLAAIQLLETIWKFPLSGA